MIKTFVRYNYYIIIINQTKYAHLSKPTAPMSVGLCNTIRERNGLPFICAQM